MIKYIFLAITLFISTPGHADTYLGTWECYTDVKFRVDIISNEERWIPDSLLQADGNCLAISDFHEVAGRPVSDLTYTLIASELLDVRHNTGSIVRYTVYSYRNTYEIRAKDILIDNPKQQ